MTIERSKSVKIVSADNNPVFVRIVKKDDEGELTDKNMQSIMYISSLIFGVFAASLMFVGFFYGLRPLIARFLISYTYTIFGYSIITVCYAGAKAGPYFEKKPNRPNLIGSLIFFPVMLFLIVYFIYWGFYVRHNDSGQALFYFACFCLGLVSRTAIQKFGLGG
ncbi:MAG: DUF3021 family protein [Candidatus Omnitrophica bacterium]|nr:DUF3021 family protein [Candidatus Omnitrophota bacterium]